jgi:L-seryl-tRNA(Ser) seleniumtransferase
MFEQHLRALPSIDEIAVRLAGKYPHALIVAEARRVAAEFRERILRGLDAGDVEQEVAQRLERLRAPSLKRVINATGVVLHTNLGRAPLPDLPSLQGYSNLEYDLESGKRGKRDIHAAVLLERILGVPAIVVNNGAAAAYLVLDSLAAGREVIVSRGELIEIGDGFRIPDILTRSGAILKEVGTTNRTGIEDYRRAVTEKSALLMRVHPSNFHITGFTAKPKLSELAELAHQHKLPLYEDLGSGCLIDLQPFGIQEPLASDSLAAGVSVVSFSGDKLLGGPQAGIIAGDPEHIARIRRNPMFRALRAGKLVYQALETVLRHVLFEEWERIPALRMLRLSTDQLRQRATALAAEIPGATVRPGESLAGGGSTPDQTLPAFLVQLPGNPVPIERRLRLGEPPVIVRIENGHAVVDLRTVLPSEEHELLLALRTP